jgi:hypothetical protein
VSPAWCPLQPVTSARRSQYPIMEGGRVRTRCRSQSCTLPAYPRGHAAFQPRIKWRTVFARLPTATLSAIHTGVIGTTAITTLLAGKNLRRPGERGRRCTAAPFRETQRACWPLSLVNFGVITPLITNIPTVFPQRIRSELEQFPDQGRLNRLIW